MGDYKRNLLTLACSLILVTAAFTALTKHLKYDFKTGTEIVKLHEAHFLSITVCPAYQSAYKRVLLENYGASVSQYRRGDFFTPNASKSPKEVFDEVTFNLNEIVKSVTIARSNDVVKLMPSSGEATGWSWTEKVYVIFGKCYVLQLESEFVSSGVNNIAIQTNMDALVYLHHPGQFYAQNSRTRIALSKGENIYVDITFDIISQNPYSKKENHCKATMDTGFDQCYANSYDANYLKQFGCLSPFARSSSYPICDVGQNQTLAKRMKKFLREQNVISIPEACGDPCSFSNVIIGFPIRSKSSMNSTYGKLHFRTTLKKTYLTEDYPLMTMIGEIGGYTGLLLGVSLLDMYELMKTLFAKTFQRNVA